ncbi:MAG TPA: hypothetical protein VH539_20500 [Gemmatimonadaceae bacterium]|jgi:hypothetical protein
MQTVAIILHSDRHVDPEVVVFASRDDAIAEARRRAQECNRFGDMREQLTASMQRSGWIYFATYGESNSIRVELKDVR